MKLETQLVVLPIESLIEAKWNYKEEGTEEQIQQLMASIQRDKSAGVPAVREIRQGESVVFEVIDGNHRLEALKRLQCEEVACENFGEISLAEAVTIARRRNHKWFSDDIVKLADLYKDVVLPEIPLENLQSFMPDSVEDIENLIRVAAAEKEAFEMPERKQVSSASADEFEKIELSVSSATKQSWIELLQKVKAMREDATDSQIFDVMVNITQGMLSNVVEGLV